MSDVNFSENDLIIHSLKIIKKYPQGIETKDLIQILRLTLDPSEDLEILSGDLTINLVKK